MAYAVWNPIPWLLFAFAIGFCIISVKMFHIRYPEYPFEYENNEIVEHATVFPIGVQNEFGLLHAYIADSEPTSMVEVGKTLF